MPAKIKWPFWLIKASLALPNLPGETKLEYPGHMRHFLRWCSKVATPSRFSEKRVPRARTLLVHADPRSERYKGAPGLGAVACARVGAADRSHVKLALGGAGIFPTALDSRRQLMEQLALEVHKAVGVSFEGRQEVIATLREGERSAPR